jgi:bifunctional DNA-binding transcriptional regulator/antitoxin component of YhaV-PrlF toxin-antitoxin module
MVISTKVYKDFQMSIPSEVRKELGITDVDIADWVVNKENNNVTVSFRKKSSLHDLSGMGKLDKVTNAVDLKHKSRRGLL